MRNLLDNIPTSGSPVYSIADLVFNPRVKIVEEDCHTQVGKLVDVTENLIGEYKISDSGIITQNTINSLFSSGIYEVRIKTLPTCTSIGGICRACYKATYKEDAGPLESFVRLVPDTRLSFWGYLCESFSGSLLGTRALKTPPILVRPMLIRESLSEGILDYLSYNVFKDAELPVPYRDYLERISDSLEKALFLLTLHAIYKRSNYE